MAKPDYFSRKLSGNTEAWQSNKGRLREAGAGSSTGQRGTTFTLEIPFTQLPFIEYTLLVMLSWGGGGNPTL